VFVALFDCSTQLQKTMVNAYLEPGNPFVALAVGIEEMG
jgi:hypothetical protein